MKTSIARFYDVFIGCFIPIGSIKKTVILSEAKDLKRASVKIEGSPGPLFDEDEWEDD